MREVFTQKNFATATLDTIEKANAVLEEYEAQGLILTLRQVYYQFVSRGWMDNKQTEYKRLGGILSDARLAGLIDWAMMEDRTRYVRQTNSWSSPSEIVAAVAQQYKQDLWKDQVFRPEVWIEKDALVGVIERACNDLRVSYFACRGYVSQSAQYEAAQRFRQYEAVGQQPVIFHFGDHDPSGIDMTRENEAKISLLAGFPVQVQRLALNMGQIRRYRPPPNPAKETDSRAAGYIANFGNKSWELDALEPTAIDALIRDNVQALIDKKRWAKAERAEKANREKLKAVSGRWDDVADFVG